MTKLPPARLTGKRELASNAVLDSVLTYAAKGLRVFPCHSAPGNRCSCGKSPCGTDNSNAGKHPRTQHGYQDATTGDAQIRSWAAKWPGCNWAVATGRASGLFVLDVDGEIGRASLAALEAMHGELPATLASRTGREDGGEHRWFSWPANRDIRISQGATGKGLDIRANGGYVIVPPSVHRTGRPYEWVDKNASITDAPEWLLEEVTAATSKLECNENSPVTEGKRTRTLFIIGCRLRARGEAQESIEAELLRENDSRCAPPLQEQKVQILAEDICSRYAPGPYRTDARQPLPDFLRLACDKNNLEFLGLNKRSKYRSALFAFARLVKGRQEFAGMDGLQAAERIEQELESPWERFSDVSGDPRAQLIADWEAARTAAGDGDSLTRARDNSHLLEVALYPVYSENYCRCMALFAALQQIVGENKPFAGPQVRIAKLIGVDYTTVGNYIKWGIQDGLLTRSKAYVPRLLAAEYTFDLSRVKVRDSPVSPTNETLTRASRG